MAVHLTGYEGRCCHLDWELVDADSGAPPSTFFDKRFPGVPAITIHNEKGDEGAFYIFVPHPSSAGLYKVTFFLSDTDTELANMSGEVFEIPES